MQIDAGHENAQQKAAEHDMEKGHIMLEQGLSSSPSNGSKDDDPPCSQREGATGLQCLIRKFPHLLIGPAVLFCLVVALGVFGVVYDTQASYEAAQDDAREEALSAADGLATQLTLELRAALSLGAVVKMKPNWSFLESNFQALTDELFRQAGCSRTSRISAQLSMMELELLPFGRVRASAGQSTTRNSTADIFSPELINVFVPQKGMAENGLHIKGPVPLTDSEKQAFTGGYPIFFDDTDEDESWGHPDNITHPTDCPGPPCYNPDTRRKFWGFAAALIDAGPVLRGNNVHLERLLAHKLSYTLQIPPYADPLRKATFVRGGDRPDKVSAIVSVLLPGNSWTLTVCSPEEDKILALRDGLLAMVVVVAFIVSSLLLLLLLSAKRASVLLKEQLVTNKLLQEEKVSRDALLGRQLDLIACLEQGTQRTKARPKSKLSEGQLSTLDRIDRARAEISDVRHSNEEDIKIQKLLAEGSFGKVYKGQWRGIDAAVKVIMLPGNMSGMEKREKMVVWEVAISSSLTHPNICQTYHYRIKPVKESGQSSQKTGAVGLEAKCLSDVSSSRPRSSINTDSDNLGSSFPDEVHSYEVHLVLEYCDQSSLRDALDAGAFMTPTGLNYAAQLDCALEIARAMFHLHCNNVLHLDLKTHNILLSSSSAEGKGLTCKVSDFGLSVRMDHLETHVSSLFQGTLTHMAPEVMLKGTCAKASDVYAFGIVLWELFTGSSPFHDIPPVLLGHSIVKGGKRPIWPGAVPKGYKDLASACWDQNPDARPTFEVILKELHKLREELGTTTPPLKPFQPGQRPQNRAFHFQETFALSSHPSLAQMASHDLADSHPSRGRRATPFEAQQLMEVWTQPRRNKQGAHHAEGPSAPIPTVPSPSPSNSSESHSPERPSPSEAQALMEAWLQPRKNKQGIPHTEGPPCPLPSLPSPSPPTPSDSSPHGCPATPSKAQALMEAWLQPCRDKQGIFQPDSPSNPHPTDSHLPEYTWTPSPAEVRHPEHASTPVQAEVRHPRRASTSSQAGVCHPVRTLTSVQAEVRYPRRSSTPFQAGARHPELASDPLQALSHASMGVPSPKAREDSPHTTSTRSQEEGKTGSAFLLREQAGQGGHTHPQLSAQEGVMLRAAMPQQAGRGSQEAGSNWEGVSMSVRNAGTAS